MSEKRIRTESLEPLNNLANDLVHEIGERPEQRLNWLMHQTGESFGEVLKQINSSARGLVAETHNFDGENVQAGTIGASVPPDQDDKVVLLDELIQSTQRHILQQRELNGDAQSTISELAVAIPTVVNKLHLFKDGNGRTSRLLRMVLRDGDQITEEKLNSVINKTSGFDKYDTSPAEPIETSITQYMREVNATGELSVVDDVVEEDTLADEVHQDIRAKFPNIDPSVIRAYRDTPNFYETVRLLGKEKGKNDTVSIGETFKQTTEDEQELFNLIAVYKGVRKQRVELLIKGLTSEENIPLKLENKEKDVSIWINSPRRLQGLAPIDPSAINTVQDFQIAYCETFSPSRKPLDVAA
jgi:hypothetical protein